SSLQGTLNHIYLVDVLYQDRLEGRKTAIKRLNQILEPELAQLRTAHAALDAWYVSAIDTMPAERLKKPFPFHTIPDNVYLDLPLEVCLTNLYQHQIHHRGQAHNMLSQAGMDPPPLDFILFKHEFHG
ncbi:MAG: hypothetical protein EXQ96_08800, partial [Alphaproteobacteria bacterium]|nr:hypothetical protein [Alphaproteobacteria bacterium]